LNSPNPSTLSLKDKEKESAVARPSIDDRVRSLKIAKSDRIDSQRSGGFLPWLLVFLLAGLCGWLSYRDKELLSKLGLAAKPESSATSSASTSPAKPTEVTTTKASPSVSSNSPSIEKAISESDARTDSPPPPNKIALESRGYVIAKHQVLVSPQVSGRIMSLNIEEGRRVTKGEVLAEIERTEYLADFEQTRGILLRNQAELKELETGARPQELAGAKADLDEQEAILKQLEAQYKRSKEAVRTNAVSIAEYEQAESSYYSTRQRIEKLKQSLNMMKEGPRKERIDMARAAVVQAEANLAKSQWRLDNCTIRAPISGTILKKNAEQGNLVNPVAFNGSFSVCDIADLSDLEIDLNIQERDVSKVFVQQSCEVRSEAFPKRVYKATVSRLMPIADRAKGAVPVRVAVKVPEEEQGVYLKPEMSAIVVFFGESPR
jgi:HlyD family secretion protein